MAREPILRPLDLTAPAVTDSIRIVLSSDPRGECEVPASPRPRVAIHTGPPTDVTCRRGGERHRGKAIYGDIDVIPAGMSSLWEYSDTDKALVLSLSPTLLHAVAEQSGLDPYRVEIRNRFQIRDLQIEHIAMALQTEMEDGYPCGRLYCDSLATALAARLLRNHSSVSRQPAYNNGGLASRQLKRVLAFVEDNISQYLSVSDMAGVAGLSVSHFEALFRKSTGQPPYSYVIRRRVERAAELLREGRLSISQIALDTGFAHQSHLARHMRRMMGVSPKVFQSSLG